MTDQQIDPQTVTIQGDISRTDTIALVDLTSGKRVIEFGVGGSTLIMARCANQLTSYDTDHNWLDRTNQRLATLDHKTCEPQLKFYTNLDQGFLNSLIQELVNTDVLFIDGKPEHRQALTALCKYAPITICHDSLGGTDSGDSAMSWVLAAAIRNLDTLYWLHHIDFHYQDSNLVVIYRRDKPMRYVNWNETETNGRISPY